MVRGEHLGELEALVLTAVIRVRERAYGMSVYQEIMARTGREVSRVAVHVTLRRLQAKRLLVSKLGERSLRGGRRRRYYRTTPEGIRALQEFRTMWRDAWRGLKLPDPETL